VNRKWLPIVIILLLVALVFFIKYRQGNTGENSLTNSGNTTVNRERGFDRRTEFLKISNHARCRMKCRQISMQEIEQIMREGSINYKKSDLQKGRCPRYALEGFTSDNQHVRIIFAQCKINTTVVTVIDLETEWSCDCPGDEHAFIITNSKLQHG
jgi:Domain of unknown function (DUF4258)